jgi:hypothetical protein
MKHKNSRTTVKSAALAVLVGAGLLAGCVPATTGNGEGIGFRQARFQEISAMRSYRGCVDDAMKVAEDARRQGHAAGYQRSAQILEKCEADLGPEAATLAQEERMRAYAVSVLNYVKAGDIVSAKANLETFKKTFDGHDLYLPDGSSFIDTLTLITAVKDKAQPHRMAMMNVSQDLRMEMQRVAFWKRN